MTEYLLSLGHRRIGFIHGHPDHLAAKRRYVAFHDAMSASQETEELTEIGSFTFAGGWGAAEKLLAREQPPTAIFAANDEMAAGVVAAAFNCGIGVPNGLSVAGFDDSPYARLTPVPLTSVNQPIADMVEATIAMLIGEKGPSGVGDQLRLPCKVIERSSTRPFARS